MQRVDAEKQPGLWDHRTQEFKLPVMSTREQSRHTVSYVIGFKHEISFIYSSLLCKIFRLV